MNEQLDINSLVMLCNDMYWRAQDINKYSDADIQKFISYFKYYRLQLNDLVSRQISQESSAAVKKANSELKAINEKLGKVIQDINELIKFFNQAGEISKLIDDILTKAKTFIVL